MVVHTDPKLNLGPISLMFGAYKVLCLKPKMSDGVHIRCQGNKNFIFVDLFRIHELYCHNVPQQKSETPIAEESFGHLKLNFML